jgi:predicted outer membrane repeat protein
MVFLSAAGISFLNVSAAAAQTAVSSVAELQQRIHTAVEGDTIRLSGTFPADLAVNEGTLSLSHNRSFTIDGAGAGILAAPAAKRHFNITSSGTGTVRFRNMTLQHAGSNATGGIRVAGGNCILESCTFSGIKNKSVEAAGANVKVDRCRFDKNDAGIDMGPGSAGKSLEITDSEFTETAGMPVGGQQATLIIANTDFVSNNGTAVYGGAKGTITNCYFANNANGCISPGSASDFVIRHSSFIRNANADHGGAIRVTSGAADKYSTLTVDRCYFERDSVINGRGGAIGSAGQRYVKMDITSSFFKNNRVVGTSTVSAGNNRVDGGAIAVSCSGMPGNSMEINISGCNFDGNYAEDDGGAILCEGNITSTVVKSAIRNCTFTHNTCPGAQYGMPPLVYVSDGSGAAICFYGMTESEITHCTFYGNTVTGTNAANGGGAVALDTAEDITADKIPNPPILSNNIFVANAYTNPITQQRLNTFISLANMFNQPAVAALLAKITPRPHTGNVFILGTTDADLIPPLGKLKNNGNVGFDNGNTDYNNLGAHAAGHITPENVFANTVAGVPVAEYFGSEVGAPGHSVQRFCYIVSPRTDEMYRDGSGPYHVDDVRTDMRGYLRDHHPNAGAVEIYWTKFDPGTAGGGVWTTPPPGSIRSLVNAQVYYLVTNPAPDNMLVTLPRYTFSHPDPKAGFEGWESNRPANPNDPPGRHVFPLIQPSVAVESAKQTYTAKWHIDRFRVDFDLQHDGLWGKPLIQVPDSTTVQEPPRPAKWGNRMFDGWFREPECITPWDFANDRVRRDIILYALWTPNPHVWPEDLDYDLSPVPCDGGRRDVTVKPGPGVKGMGTITVKYNGQPYYPYRPGQYDVTVEIASGEVYAATRLHLGLFVIEESAYCYRNPIIERPVTIPEAEGITTSPGPGCHFVPTRENFELFIRARDGFNLNHLKVTTGIPLRDRDGIRIDRQTEDLVKVTIQMINEPIYLHISGAVKNPADIALPEGYRLRTEGGSLTVAVPCTETLRIYTLSGRLHVQKKLPAGEHVIPLPAGFYFVAFDNGTRQKMMVR